MYQITVKQYSGILLVASMLFSQCSFASTHSDPIMDTKETIYELSHLLEWEIDNYLLLDSTGLILKNEALQEAVLDLKLCSEGTIDELRELIETYSHKLPKHPKDVKGFFMKNYISLRGLKSDQDVLQALYTNMKMSLEAFQRATKLHLPTKAQAVVQTLYDKKKEDCKIIHDLM